MTPKALLFDVFGTTVSWHSTITSVLSTAAAQELSSSTTPDNPSLSDPLAAHKAQQRRNALSKASSLPREFWDSFAMQWRKSYAAFVATYASAPEEAAGVTLQRDKAIVEAGRESQPTEISPEDRLPFITVDSLHYCSLVTLLQQHNLTGLFPPAILLSLTRSWHFLPAHADATAGLSALNHAGITTCTLGNGNSALQADLGKFTSLPFTKRFSVEEFETYKTRPSVYLGACEKLGLQPEEVGMVAAHMNDAIAAKNCGLKAYYVEREGEEEWADATVREIVQSGRIDGVVWAGDGGFEGLAKLLGV